MADTPLGRFCWYDLMTTAPGEAPAFYGTVTGWGTTPFEEGDEPYTMWTNDGVPIGGVVQLPEQAADAGAPPFWIGYVSTPDLSATVARAKKLGASLVHEESVPTVGAIATIQDPQGVVIGLYQPEREIADTDDLATVGNFSWHELATEDWESAWAFYSELFEWEEMDQMDMGPIGTYHMFGRRGTMLGGMFDRPKEIPVPAWFYYVRVADMDAAVEAVNGSGGSVWNGPMTVPGGDLIAQCADPQGAAFAIHSS